MRKFLSLLWIFSFLNLSPLLAWPLKVSTQTLGLSVPVTQTLYLIMSTTPIAFSTINEATMGTPNPYTLGSVEAFTTQISTPIYLTMTSVSQDANLNPTMTYNGNAISFSVSFEPCVPSGYAPEYLNLQVGVKQQIAYPYSFQQSCAAPLGNGAVGSIVFTRLALSQLPPAGTYTGTVTFTLTAT